MNIRITQKQKKEAKTTNTSRGKEEESAIGKAGVYDRIQGKITQKEDLVPMCSIKHRNISKTKGYPFIQR